MEYARSLGDLSENAEYQEARDQQGKIEDRIAQVEFILKHAVVVAPHSSDKAEVGSTVVVRKKGDKEDKTFTIVGPEEVGPGRISYSLHWVWVLSARKKETNFRFQLLPEKRSIPLLRLSKRKVCSACRRTFRLSVRGLRCTPFS